MKCVWLHHNNPYLLLGPFKFEQKHQNPEIAIIHDLISYKETQTIQNLARGKMKSTPLLVGRKQKSFSKQRTSKVMYMNEHLIPEAMSLTRRIELATRFKLYNEKYASENYQVMNYGVGGKISAHADIKGEIFSQNSKSICKFCLAITIKLTYYYFF